jgi:hypothetical protein
MSLLPLLAGSGVAELKPTDTQNVCLLARTSALGVIAVWPLGVVSRPLGRSYISTD